MASYSVNGDKQDGGFDDVEGEVFPCAGSYRSGVTIRLLKVGGRTVIIRCEHVAKCAAILYQVATLRQDKIATWKVEMSRNRAYYVFGWQYLHTFLLHASVRGTL